MSCKAGKKHLGIKRSKDEVVREFMRSAGLRACGVALGYALPGKDAEATEDPTKDPVHRLPD